MSKDSPTFDEKFSLVLLDLRIRALLLGGVACNLYGSTRYSEDVDWWIDPSDGLPAWMRRVFSAIQKAKSPCEIMRLRNQEVLFRATMEPPGEEETLKLEAAIRNDGLIRLQDGNSKVDLFYFPNNLVDFEAAWRRSKLWDGCLRLLSIEDLILSKKDTGRAKDEEDLRFLQKIH